MIDGKAELLVENEKISIKGFVHFENVKVLWQQGLSLMENLETVIIDLQQLVKTDSSILALCLSWVRELQGKNKAITFIHAPSFVKDLVKVHQLEPILKGV